MPVVDTSQNFATGDTVTSTSLNNIMDQSIFVNGAVVTGDGLTVTAGGQMTIENLKVTGSKIGNLEISTGKIANDAITTAKIANDAIITAKIANANITPEKLSGAQTGSAPIFGIRAFGAFNGAATTPITPISSGNVASIVRTATGTYRITLTTAMSDANYCVVANEFHRTGVSYGTSASVTIIDSSSFSIQTGDASGGGPYNSTYIGFFVIK